MARDKMIPRPDRAELIWDGIAERIRPRLTRQTDVCELGCSRGRLTMALCGSAGLWEASDSDESVIGRLSKLPHNERVRFTVQDPQSLPFEHSTFGAAVLSDSFLAFRDPALALRELRRVLKPGGILFCAAHVWGGLRALRPGRADGKRVRHRYTAAALLALVESAGFIVEKQVLLSDDPAPLCYLEAVNSKSAPKAR